jgi:DNA-binding NarL/FixJ family response regulator
MHVHVGTQTPMMARDAGAIRNDRQGAGTMQTRWRHSPFSTADERQAASARTCLDPASDGLSLERQPVAERQIAQIMDALATARESLARCERALEHVTQAQRLATLRPLALGSPSTARAAVVPARNGSGAEHSGTTTPALPPELLTTREAQVLELVVAGLSNKEIAAALCISPHTAANHVANIMNKLGLDSRTAVAAWALRQHAA